MCQIFVLLVTNGLGYNFTPSFETKPVFLGHNWLVLTRLHDLLSKAGVNDAY